MTGLTKGIEFLMKKNKVDLDVQGTAQLTGNGRGRGNRRRGADAESGRKW